MELINYKIYPFGRILYRMLLAVVGAFVAIYLQDPLSFTLFGFLISYILIISILLYSLYRMIIIVNSDGVTYLRLRNRIVFYWSDIVGLKNTAGSKNSITIYTKSSSMKISLYSYNRKDIAGLIKLIEQRNPSLETDQFIMEFMLKFGDQAKPF